MTLLRVSILLMIGLNSIIGEPRSADFSSSESLESGEKTDLGYRPWTNNNKTKTWISLEGMGITTINYLFRLNVPDLEWLVMDQNNIRVIPSDAFKFLPDLTYISLAGNNINNFGMNAFGSLDKLQILDLDRNPIPEIDTTNTNIFNGLTALEHLYLRSCGLSSFKIFEPINSLSHLYLSSNQLNTIRVENQTALTHLYLDNNQLRTVSLLRLHSLIYFNGSSNSLSKIRYYSDHSLDDLQNMYWYPERRALYLEFAPALEYLILSNNEISEIESDSFLGTGSLIHVDLSVNKIREMKAGTFNDLSKLEDIILDSNEITQINYRAFVNLPNLKTLSLKNNKIHDIDEDAFTKLNSNANEVYLFLDNNEIHTLKRGSFRDIKGLKHIGLSNNRIKTILTQAFVNLPNLGSLVIENQSYDQTTDLHSRNHEIQLPVVNNGLIESRAFSNLPNLTSIIIRGNVFTDIESQAFHSLPKLTILDLSDNGIEKLSAEAFSELPELETLYLRQNHLCIIEPGTYPKQLKNLDLAGNIPCPDHSCWNVEELQQLEQLNIAGVIGRFKIEDFDILPRNLTIVM